MTSRDSSSRIWERDFTETIWVIIYVSCSQMEVLSPVFCRECGGVPDPRSELKPALPLVLRNAWLPCVSLSSHPHSFSFLSLLSFVRELPSMCAGNLRQGGVGMVYCQRLHCWEATHYTWENFLHLWLWSIYSAVLQRKIWNLRFTTHWCEQEGTTSCETGNRTLVLRLEREFIFWCINRNLRKRIKKALMWIPNKKNGQSMWNRAVHKRRTTNG